jgi:hypothetical protein
MDKIVINKMANGKETEMKKFKKGDKVRTLYGKIETVLMAYGCQVFTYENTSGWYHPSNVWKIKN